MTEPNIEETVGKENPSVKISRQTIMQEKNVKNAKVPEFCTPRLRS